MPYSFVPARLLHLAAAPFFPMAVNWAGVRLRARALPPLLAISLMVMPLAMSGVYLVAVASAR